MTFDDELCYGVVLTRLPRDHEWWHGHMFRSDLRYWCHPLGRPTTLLFMIQKLGVGVVPLSRPFLITLDGEGTFGQEADTKLCGWD